MTRLRIHLGLPVLAKELTEQANRRRTYGLRALYAGLLYSVWLLMLYDQISDREAVDLLGTGEEMLGLLVWFQVWAIYLLLPVMLCGAITSERERNTLPLLFLADLGPWEILLQKLLSRLATVMTFMMLNLPLLAVAYAFGGVGTHYLLVSVYCLALLALQVGAVTIFCSAFCRTVGGAFVLAAVTLFTMHLFGPLLLVILGVIPDAEEVAFALVPFYPLADGSYLHTRVFTDTLIQTAGVWVTVLAFLLLARWALTARANVQPRNPLRDIFARIDRVMTAVNRRLGGVELLRGRGGLPDDRPVAWLERSQRAIARPHYLVRLALLFEVPVFAIYGAISYASSAGWEPEISVEELHAWGVFVLWIIAGLWLPIQGARVFAAERSRQTLDVLLTTPLPTRQILHEKMGVLYRIAAILMAPILTVTLFASLEADEGFNTMRWTCTLLAVLIYPAWAIWLSCWLGMRIKRPARAAAIAAAAVAIWCATPIGAYILTWSFYGLFSTPDWVEYILLVSPAFWIIINEFGGLGHWQEGVAIAAHFGGHLAMLLALRWWCLRRADRMLGRVAPPEAGPLRGPAIPVASYQPGLEGVVERGVDVAVRHQDEVPGLGQRIGGEVEPD